MPGVTDQMRGPAVRPLTDDDDLEGLNADNPLGWLVLLWREMAKGSDLEVHWFVGLLDGRPVGVAAACPRSLAAAGYGKGAVTVLSQARRHGVGSALRDAVAGVCRGRVPGIEYIYSEADDESAAAAAAWGLTEVGRHRESVLHLTEIDRGLLEAKASAARAVDVTLATLPPLDQLTEADWRLIHEFVSARWRETPDANGADDPMPYALFRNMLTEPWMLMTAKRGGEYVGATLVDVRPGDAKAVNVMITGVAPQTRRQGVAAALKARHALLLADQGFQQIYTQNMDGNAPILASNTSMGFVPAAGYVAVHQHLTAIG